MDVRCDQIVYEVNLHKFNSNGGKMQFYIVDNNLSKCGTYLLRNTAREWEANYLIDISRKHMRYNWNAETMWGIKKKIQQNAYVL